MSKRQMFRLDYSQYNGSQVSAVKQSFAKRFPITTETLKQRIELPGVKAVRQNMVDRGLSEHFIRYEKTTTFDAEIFLSNYTIWNIKHMLNTSGLKMETATELFHRLIRQPVGYHDPPHEDTMCYEAHNILQVATPPPTATAAAAAASTARRTTLRSASRVK